MATYTSFLNLEKPTTSETFNLLKLNQNWDKIDQGVSSLNSKMANKLKKVGSQAKIYTLNNLSSIECLLVYGAGGSQSAFAFLVAVQPSNNSVKSYDIITSNFYPHTEEYADGTLTITFTGSDGVYSGLYVLDMRNQ